MLTFTGIIIIVFGILQIILFFKIWGMTNDVKAIKNKYLKVDSSTKEISNNINQLDTQSPIPNNVPLFTECGNEITFTDGKKGRIKTYPRNKECSIYDSKGKEIIYNDRQAAIQALYTFLTTGEISNTNRYDPTKDNR